MDNKDSKFLVRAVSLGIALLMAVSMFSGLLIQLIYSV